MWRRHDIVVRFNGGDVGNKWMVHVGNRTDMRVLNHLNSRMACCKSSPILPEANRMGNMTLMLWCVRPCILRLPHRA